MQQSGCTQTTQCNGHWTDCTVLKCHVVKHIKSYIPDNDDNENAEQPQFRSKSLILQIFKEIREKKKLMVKI